MSIYDGNDNVHDDEDEDLSAADRGDDFKPDGDEDDDKDDDNGDAGKGDDKSGDRDDKGRFKKADDKPAGKDEKPDDGDDKDDDGDEDEDEDDDGDEDDAGKGKNLGIRLNKMKDQRDTERRAREDAERRAAELQARLDKIAAPGEKPAPKVDPVEALNTELDGLYEQVEAARADGDVKEAAKLQRQIDSKNREISRIEAEQVATRASAEVNENQRFDMMLAEIEKAHPVLDKDSDDFDPKAVKAVEYYINAHEKMGHSATKALRLAIKDVFGDAPAAKKDEPAGKKDDKQGIGKKTDDKKKTDVGKNAKTADRLPPDLSNRGTNKDQDIEMDVDKLSDEEWDALPESKKAALRGDKM